MNKSEVAARITEARKAKDLSMVALAEIIGVSHQAIQKWEAGENLPRANRLDALGRALERQPQWFMFGDRGLEKASELIYELQDLQEKIDQAIACLRAADSAESKERDNLITAARRILESH